MLAILPPILQIRNVAKEVGREMWSTPTHATDLVASLNDTPGCYVEWDLDGSGRLNKVFWSTADQQLFAQQHGRLVIQDNTYLPDEQVSFVCGNHNTLRSPMGR